MQPDAGEDSQTGLETNLIGDGIKALVDSVFNPSRENGNQYHADQQPNEVDMRGMPAFGLRPWR